MKRYRVLKNVTHPKRGLVRPDDANPFVDLSHLAPATVVALESRGIVAREEGAATVDDGAGT